VDLDEEVKKRQEKEAWVDEFVKELEKKARRLLSLLCETETSS